MNNEYNCGQFVTEKKQLFDNSTYNKKPLAKKQGVLLHIYNGATNAALSSKKQYPYNFTTLAACGPRAPSTMSNSTCCPSSNDLYPSC